ncbi:MAG TPA: hypothetical protein VGK41_01000 [Solirubrobacterales bacterium]
MLLDWELTDLKQNLIARLDGRRGGGWVELGSNAGRAAFCPLSIEDPAYQIAEAVKTLLRITLRDPRDGWSLPLFIGRVTIPETKDGKDGEQLGLSARDPFFHLSRLLVRQVTGSVWEARTFKAIEQELIMWSLIENAPASHGIIKGALSASGVKRDRTYPPTKEIALAIQQMAEVINGPDFEVQPIVAADGTFARFNTFYPQQGSDKTGSVKFIHRREPNGTTEFNLAPAGDDICNRCVAVGAPIQEPSEGSPYGIYPGYVAEHAASIAAYGAWERRVQFEDVKETATLQAHAQAVVAASAFPIPHFDYTAAPERASDETGDGVPPIFGRDYWLNDLVRCEAHLPQLADPLVLDGRVVDAKVTEDESTGQLKVKTGCSILVSSAGLTGQAITLKIPEGLE